MRLFLNVRRTRGLVWVFNVVTILCIVFVLFSMLKKVREGEFKSRPQDVFLKKLQSGVSKDDQGTARQKNINDHSSLWRVSIDGTRRKDKTAGETTKPADLIPKNEQIASVLEVTLILHSPKAPEESKARIKYLNESSTEKTIARNLWSREGDPLKAPYDKSPREGKVLRIEESQVVFMWYGEEVALGPKGFESSADRILKKETASKVPDTPLQKYRNRPPAETEEFKPGHFALSEKEYKQVTENYENILKDVTLTTYTNPETGKKSIKLGDVKEDSIVYKRGYRKGDILISINGFPVSSKAQAINYCKQHPNEGTYVVEIDRMGRRVYKTYYYDNK